MLMYFQSRKKHKINRYIIWLSRALIALCTVFVLVRSYPIFNIFAVDTTYTWLFPSNTDYTLSDNSKIEVASNVTRLKVQENTSDVSTGMLLHLNEASGNPADSASPANTATASNVTYGSGQLNNGATFNGSTSSISVADSASLSFSQAHTIESWTKFASSFSAGSHAAPQPIVDKGNYKLYYDQRTGKLNYELAKSGATNWTQVAGSDWINGLYSKGVNSSWDQNGKPFLNSSAVIGTDLYVGLGNTVGDAEVWKWNGSAWTLIGGNGLNSSWADGTATPATQYEQVTSMTTDGTSLFVGLGSSAGDAEVWKWNGSIWTFIGGEGSGSAGQSWIASTYEQVTSLASDGTNLFVGLGASATDAEVWTCAISSCTRTSGWTKIGGDGTTVPPQSWGTSYEAVYSIAISGTTLLVSLGNTAGDAELWSCTIGSCTVTTGWSKRGGDGSGTAPQSWASVQELSQLAVSGTKVYVGLGNTGNEGQVWMCDLAVACTTTTGWSIVGGGGTGSGGQSWTTGYEQVASIRFSGTNLYVGLGLSAADSEIWTCNTSGTCNVTTGWTKIGGDGSGTAPQSWGTPGTLATTAVQRIEFIGNVMYAGLTDSTGAISAMVWSCDVSVACTTTTGWSSIGGNKVNNSWNISGHQSIESMTVHNGKLYAGMGVSNARNALVWEWDGSNWGLIGGQGLSSSWAAYTYETVQSMISFGGNLYVGLGVTAQDAEVWKWNGSVWSKVGGDASGVSPQSWSTAGNYEIVNSMAVFGNELYVGLGNSAGDAEVWKCTGTCTQTTGWTKVAGDATGVAPQSWTNAYEVVYNMAVFNNELYVGLGNTAGDAEVWKCTGTCTTTTGWTKVGGDASGVAPQSWTTAGNYEVVESLTVYNGSLYVGLGNTVGDAEVWKCATSCTTTTGWTMVGGDGVSSSWLDGVYERVRSLAVYNGDLYAGLGINDGDGEVWKYNGSTWVRVAGDGVNSGWTTSPTAIDNIPAMVVYNGKLYAGTGGAAGTAATNTEATVWSIGDNAVLSSVATSQNTSWHHIAATYDGSTMKIFIDGILDNSLATSLTLTDSPHNLLIGRNSGPSYIGEQEGFFNGYFDEIRISNIARSSFITTPYSADAQTIEADTPQLTSQIKSWSAFNTSETANGGTITYRLSIDGGTTWKYWSGSAWATSSNTTQANDRATINTNISTLTAGPGGIVWQAVLDGDGNQLVTLNSVEVVGVADTTAPTNPTTLVPLSADGGVPISTDTWYAHTSPYFSWSGADDGTGSGVSGYYVYFGTDDTADPYLAGAFQVSPTYTGVGLVSGSTYYLRIKTKDTAQNISSVIWDGAVSPAMFSYKYDGTSPSGLTINSPSPAGYAAVDNYTFTWSAATDTASSVNHYEFKTGASTGPYSTYQTTDSLTSQYITAASYQIGENIFYLKAIDNAGNESTAATKSYYYAGSGPTQPQGLTVDPTTNTDCSFTFSWQAPATHSGNLTGSNLSYCYTVNNRPTSGLCNGRFTSDGVLSVPNYCNEDMRNDLNTFYVVARDPANVGSSVNYGAYAEISFTLNTTEPGVPANMEVSDISIKSDELWKLTVSWTEPELNGDRVSSYRIYRSEDDVTFTKIAETSGTAYVDTGLEQQIYYYKVAACDVVQNCGAQTESVGLLPTGKYTDAAVLVSGPTASLITTKKATIKWGTDRGSDSKVQYGTSPGSYFTEEPSNSTQITDHEITLNNLTPGTQYYFKTKWTDEDGNTGKSAEKSFTTEPAPNVKDVSARKVGINTATIQFTSTGATKVKIYYGETSAFGNVKTISTSASETTADVELESLKDDVKHYYKVNAFDSDGVEYEGTTLSFLTLPRPLVKGVRVQQIAGTAQTIVLVSWTSNTPLSSIVTYFPTSNPSDAKDEVGVELVAGEHQIILRGLSPVTAYTLIVSGRDKAGNEARSDRQNFTTATDTRPPKISNVKIEGSTTKVSKGSTQKLAQFVISWTTDEPATSQVEFGEGTGTSYPQKTQEESQYKVNHLVVISNIPPSRVYHMRALSKDSTDNLASSPDLVTISARGSDDALELVTTNLLETFGFLKGVVGQ